jgi:hypothetical protein
VYWPNINRDLFGLISGAGLDLKKRVCRNLSKGDSRSGFSSVNSFIAKDNFPTRFDMAWRMAEVKLQRVCPDLLVGDEN